MSTERSAILQKIQEIKVAMEQAGPVHRRDLQRHIQRMIRKLRQYDRAHAQDTHISP